MKTLIAIVFALLLGAAMGFIREKSRPGSAAVSQGQVEPADAITPEIGAEYKDLIVPGWGSWAERIGAAQTTGELETMYLELEAFGRKERDLMERVSRLMGARWAELDIEGGLKFLSNPEFESAYWVKAYLASEWAVSDLDGFVLWLETRDTKERRWLSGGVVATLLRKSPETAWVILQRSDYFPSSVPNVDEWELLANVDIDAFSEWAIGKIDENNPRSESMVALVAALRAKEDPAAAFEWAKSVPEIGRSKAIGEVFKVWIKLDPRAVAERLGELKNKKTGSTSYIPSGARQLQDQIVEAIGKENPGEALGWLATTGNGVAGGQHLMKSLLASGEITPEQAYELIRSHDDQDKSAQIHLNVPRSMWKGLTADQMAPTFDMLRAQPDGWAHRLATNALLREWFSRDPEAGLEHFRENVPSAERGDYYFGIADAIRRASGRGAEGQLLGLMTPEEQVDVLEELFSPNVEATGWRMLDGGMYAEMIEELAGESDMEEVRKKLAYNWSQSDPRATMEWASRAASGGDVIAREAAAEWAAGDAYGFSEYLAGAPPGSHRDVATEVLVSSVQETEPDSAWAWIGQIDDPQRAQDLRRSVIETWARVDAEGAGAALDDAVLSAAEREALRAVIDGR